MKKIYWQVFLFFSVITSLILLKPGPPDFQKLSESSAGTLPLGHITIIVDEPNTKVYINDELEGLAHPDRPMVRQYLPAGDLSVKIRFPDNTEQLKEVCILPDQTSEVMFLRPGTDQQSAESAEDAFVVSDDDRPPEIILQEADRLYDLQRYTSPENNNAVQLYQYVLKKDPANVRAKERIAAVMTLYHTSAVNADKESDFQKANEYYGKYLITAQLLQKIAPELLNLNEFEQNTKRKTEIGSLLESADELIKKGDIYFIAQRYTTPKDMNALNVYLEVLKIDPLNRRARSKISKMMSMYETWGNTAFDQQKYSNAKMFFNQYLMIANDAERVIKESFNERTRKTDKQLALIREIEQYLKEGDVLFQKGQLVEGEKNALRMYKEVIKKHPANHHARNRVQIIAKKLKHEGDKAYAENRFAGAKAFYQDYIAAAGYMFSITRNRQYEREIGKVRERLANMDRDLNNE